MNDDLFNFVCQPDRDPELRTTRRKNQSVDDLLDFPPESDFLDESDDFESLDALSLDFLSAEAPFL